MKKTCDEEMMQNIKSEVDKKIKELNAMTMSETAYNRAIASVDQPIISRLMKEITWPIHDMNEILYYANLSQRTSTL